MEKIMKNQHFSLILISSAFALSSLSFYRQAQSFEFVAMDNSISTKMCIDAASNNKRALKHKMNLVIKQQSIRYRTFTRVVKCNDQHIALFALTYGANKTFSFLNAHSKEKFDVGITDLAKVDSPKLIQVISTVK